MISEANTSMWRIGDRVKVIKKAVARRPFSFRVLYANARNVLRRRGIVVITTLGANTSVPDAGIRGRNESAAHRGLSGSHYQEKHMNRFDSYFKPLNTLLMALLAAAVVAGCGGDDGAASGAAGGSGPATASGVGTGVGGAGQGPAPVNLGAAGAFVILAESAITNVPASAITGNVGLSPGTGAAIGLTCVEVTGVINDVDSTGPLPCTVMNAVGLTAAIGAKGTAYTDAQGRAPDYTELGAGDIGGLNLGPATYRWGTGVLIPTNVTLTGGANDVWIFQIAQGLTVAPGVQIILAGGALPQNIYWATFGAATLDTTTQFKGVILSQTSIAMRTGASIDGRLFAGTAVTLDQNRVTQP